MPDALKSVVLWLWNAFVGVPDDRSRREGVGSNLAHETPAPDEKRSR